MTGGDCPVRRFDAPLIAPQRRTIGSVSIRILPAKPHLERGDTGGDPRAKRIVRRQVMQTFVVFPERQHADKQHVLILRRGPFPDFDRAVLPRQFRDDVGVEQPPIHSTISRPISRSRATSSSPNWRPRRNSTRF